MSDYESQFKPTQAELDVVGKARRLNFLFGALLSILLSIMFAGGAYLVHEEKQSDFTQQEIARLAIENRNAVCAFTNDLRRRIEQGKLYIQQVNAGETEELLQVPVEVVRVNVANQQRTLKAFDNIDCPD